MTHWLAQRFSALLLLLALTVLVCFLAALPDVRAGTVAEALSSPWAGWLAALSLAGAYWHAALGVQVIVEDYISRIGLRHFIIYASFALMTLAWLACVLALRSLQA